MRRQRQSLAGRAESLLAQAAASYSSVVSQLAGDLLQADAQLSASFGQAQTTVLAASLAADELIDQQFEAARRQLAQARRSGLAAVRRNAETAGDQITAIVADLSADYVTLLDDVSWDAEMTSLAAYDAVESWGSSVDTLFPDSGTGLQRAENEARRKAAPGLVTEALSQLATRSFDVTSSYNEASTSLQADIRNGLEPTLQEHATRVNTQGMDSVRNAHATALNGLREQVAEAHRIIADMRGNALQQLDAQQRAARSALESIAQQHVTAAHQQATAAMETAAGVREQGQARISASAQQLNDQLQQAAAASPEALEQFAGTAIQDTRQGVEQSQSLFREQLLTVQAVRLPEIAAQGAEGRVQMEERVAETGAELMTTVETLASSIGESATALTSGFAAVAGAVTQTAELWAQPLAEVFAEALEPVERQLAEGYPPFLLELNTQSDAFREWLLPQMEPATFFEPALTAAWTTVRDGLEVRIEKLVAALDYGIIDKVDEGGVTGALRGLTAAQGAAITQLWYMRGYILERTLAWALDEGSDDYYAAINYVAGNTAIGARYELEASMHWYNDEEDRIEAIMRALTPEQLEELHGLDEWEETREEVREALDEDSTDLNVFEALDAGNPFRADAYRMQQRIDSARRRGDDDALNTVLAEYSRAATAEEHGGRLLSAEERRQRVQREFAHIRGEVDLDAGETISEEAAAESLYAYAIREIEVTRSAGRGETYTETLRVGERQQDLARALIFLGEGSVEARAARLGVEAERSGGPDIMKLDEALVDPRLNPNNPVPDEVRERARRERQEVFELFATRYGSGPPDSPEAAQAEVITQLQDEDLSDTGNALVEGLVRDEHSTPATAGLALEFAMEGVGTTEELIDRTLGRMNRDEIAEMRAGHRARTGKDLYAEMGVFGHGGTFTELSGEDRLRAERLLLGQPRNDRERAEVAAFAIHQRREETGAFGRWLAEGSRQERSLEYNEAELNAMVGGPITFGPDGQPQSGPYVDQFDAEGRFRGDPAEFAARIRGAELSAQNYGAKIDQFVNFATMAALVGAIIVGALASLIPGVGLVAAAAIGAAAAAIITIGAKLAIKGGAYGWEEIATDAAVGAVDVAISIPTAGIGGAALKAARAGRFAAAAASRGTVRGMFARGVERLGAMAVSPSRTQRVFAHAVVEGGEGLVSAFPSALTGNLLNEQNWKQGNILANIALGTVLETGLGAVLGAGVGSLGGIRMPHEAGPVPRTGDILAHRGRPEERLAAWRRYQAENPGADMRTFLRQFDQGVALRLADQDAAQQLQRRLRGQMLSGLPPAQRGVLAGVPMQVVGDADFARLSRGQPGPGALVTLDGRLRLLVVEGAPPQALAAQADALSRQVVRGLDGQPVHVDAVLPRDLRGRVPVTVDPALRGNTVRVHYEIDEVTGLVRNIHVRAGVAATANDIRLHVGTVRLMRRYAGLAGQVRRLLDRMAAWMALNGTPPPGTRGWEARLELEKLPRIIQDRLAQLDQVAGDPGAQRRLLADIAGLQRQIDQHRLALRDMEMEPGRGYVAAEAVPAAPARAALDLDVELPPGTVAPEVRALVGELSHVLSLPQLQTVVATLRAAAQLPEGQRLMRLVRTLQSFTAEQPALQQALRERAPTGVPPASWQHVVDQVAPAPRRQVEAPPPGGPARYEDIDPASFWDPEWGDIKNSRYGSLLDHLRARPDIISPAQLQTILSRAPRDYDAILNLLADLQRLAIRTSDAATAGYEMEHLPRLVRGLLSDDPQTAAGARFLLQSIARAPKQTAIARADAVLRRMDLAEIEQLRRTALEPREDLSDQDAFNALVDITTRINGGSLATMRLIAQAGSVSGLADAPDIFRLQSILRGMGDGPHSPAAVLREIRARNRMAAQLAALGDDYIEAIFGVLSGAQFVNGVRQIANLPRFIRDGEASGALMSTYFRDPVIVAGVVRNVVGKNADYNGAAWNAIQNAIRATDMPVGIKNNILGEYWEQVNLQMFRNGARPDLEDVVPQMKVAISGQVKTARLDAGLIHRIDPINNRVEISFEEYKVGQQEDRALLRHAQREVYDRIMNGRLDELHVVLPDHILRRLTGPGPIQIVIRPGQQGIRVVKPAPVPASDEPNTP